MSFLFNLEKISTNSFHPKFAQDNVKKNVGRKIGAYTRCSFQRIREIESIKISYLSKIIDIRLLLSPGAIANTKLSDIS